MLYKNRSESTGRAPKKATLNVESAGPKNQWLIQFAVNCALCMGALVLGMSLPANAQTQGGVEVTSANVPQDMIVPRDQIKGIHFYQSGEFFSKFSDRKSTPSGLYLLDTEVVPKQLPAILAKNNVILGPDGTVINQKGAKVVLILGYRMAAVEKNAVNPGFSGLTGQMSPSPNASPFPLQWVSYWYSWVDDEGFCRSMTSSTGADAWGPIIDSAGDRVHTNIDYIQAVADAADAYVSNWGFGISWQFAQAHRDFGCFWPAHGGGQWGWVYFQDGGWNWYASW
jgi:hypothetical protein